MKVLFLKGKTMSRNTLKDAPYREWWSLLEGTENPFTEVTSLYHALSNEEAKVTGINVTSDYRMILTVECDDKCAIFDLDTRDSSPYLREIVRFTTRRNRIMAKILSGIWTHQLQNMDMLTELTSG